jgi:tetratricopeptide (TPR) repeat protein
MSVRFVALLILSLVLCGAARSQGQKLPELLRDGRQALQVDDFPRAAHDFAQAILLAPENLEVNRGLLLSDLQIGHFDDALRVGRAAVTKWPKDAQLQHWLGRAYFNMGRDADALTWLRGSEGLAPTQADIPFDTALVLLSDTNYSEAAIELEKAVKLNSKSALTHVLLGRAYQNTNRTVQAVEQFQIALRQEPDVSLGHYHLGFAYASLGRNEEAIGEYEKELERSPHNPVVLYQLGHCELEAGLWKRATEHLKRAEQLDPGNADVPYDLGKTLLLQGDAEAAVIPLRRAIELKPSSPSAHYQLARALEKSGKKEEATREMETFIALKKAQPATGGMAAGPVQ